MEVTRFTIKELPPSERPYEKCEEYGPQSLSDAELLAVIIRSGVKGKTSVELARNLLNTVLRDKGLIGIHQLTAEELLEVKGIGRVKAVQLQCIAELSKRMARSCRTDTAVFNQPELIAAYYMEQLRHLQKEQVVLILMDSKCHILKDMTLSIGTVNSCLLVPREVLVQAVKYQAVQFVLLHNHPSGDPTPSSQDITATLRVRDAANIIGIQLMDHIVIGDNKYISLKEQGII